MTTKLSRFAVLCAGVVLAGSTAFAATMLTGKNGMTLYVFDKDKGGTPTCYDACAAMWPAYMADTGAKAEKGWTEVKRKDGKMQWAYDKKPVYFYASDKAKGDKMGDGKGGIWHIVME